jgi:hypothetical protein
VAFEKHGFGQINVELASTQKAKSLVIILNGDIRRQRCLELAQRLKVTKKKNKPIQLRSLQTTKITHSKEFKTQGDMMSIPQPERARDPPTCQTSTAVLCEPDYNPLRFGSDQRARQSGNANGVT